MRGVELSLQWNLQNLISCGDLYFPGLWFLACSAESQYAFVKSVFQIALGIIYRLIPRSFSN